MGLRAYIAKRIIYSFILLLFVLIVNFLIFEVMPGDPTTLFLPKNRPVTQEEREKIFAHWGLNKPLHERIFAYMYNLLTWQLGESFIRRRPVAMELLAYLPNTLQILGISTILAIIIGVLLGAIAAHRRGGIFDSTSVTASLITYSLPTFWMGMLFIAIFSKSLGWFPVGKIVPDEWAITGWPPPLFTLSLPSAQVAIPGTTFTIVTPGFQFNFPGWEEIITRIRFMFLPVLTLTLFQYGGFLLLTRASVLETLTEDYITTARAKGLKERTVLFKHALKNASLPIITNAAISLGFIISGAIITETVFSWPGIGGWTWTAINDKDYPILQAVFYITALCVIAANFIADLIYGVIDPRIKYG
ncbi:MAG: ABC transporter permease [Candidatus Bathyarchaeia archaeon]